MPSTEALQPDKDSVLYLIDGSESMRSTSTLQRVVAAVASSILQIHRKGDRRFDVGIILYSCINKHSKRSKFRNVDVTMKVSDPQIEDFKKIIAFAKTGGNSADWQLDPDTERHSLLNGLQQAKLEMATLNPSVFRRLVIITDNDSPEEDLPEAQRIAHDLVNMNVLTVPTFIEHHGRPFDKTIFWSHLVYLPASISMASRNSQLSVSLDPCNIDQLPADFAALVQSKAERKIPVLRGELIIMSMRIGITGYNIVSRARAPRKMIHSAPVWQANIQEKNQPNEQNDNNYHTEGVPHEESNNFVLNANQSVPAGDIEGLYNIRPDAAVTQLEILGFISIDKIVSLREDNAAIYGRSGSSLLIVPSNFTLENSKAAFSSLHRSLVRKRKVAWAKLTPKQGSKAISYGLMYSFDPSTKVFEKQTEVRPNTRNGIYFVNVPYSDDLRLIQDQPVSQVKHEKDTDSVNWELLEPALRLARKFRIEQGFIPDEFPHPGRTQFYKVLESLALDYNIPIQESTDPTLPNYEKISNKASQEAALIRNALENVTEDPKESRKRKFEDLNIFYEAHSIDRLHCFKIDELKWALKKLNLVVSGKKDELIARLSSHLEEVKK